MVLFKRFVEIGRVCLIKGGPDRGKLCVIIDVIDHNRAFIDGPSDITGVARQSISFRALALTDFVIKIPRSCRLKTLRKAFEKAEILKKWNETSWAKKIALKEKRTKLNDFDRFKLMLERKKKSSLLKVEVRKLRKSYNKEQITKDPKTKKIIPNDLTTI